MTYTREELKQPRGANWYDGTWTGEYGRYFLAHAGYAGSNKMGQEVKWRDLKTECPPSVTLGTFTGALVGLIELSEGYCRSETETGDDGDPKAEGQDDAQAGLYGPTGTSACGGAGADGCGEGCGEAVTVGEVCHSNHKRSAAVGR